jgi:NAD(P)-dependent dehydrogenase (short-subunit alcohol dehydrogenase family)
VDLNLMGRCALVTGSTAGIGEAIARTLSREVPRASWRRTSTVQSFA